MTDTSNNVASDNEANKSSETSHSDGDHPEFNGQVFVEQIDSNEETNSIDDPHSITVYGRLDSKQGFNMSFEFKSQSLDSIVADMNVFASDILKQEGFLSYSIVRVFDLEAGKDVCNEDVLIDKHMYVISIMPNSTENQKQVVVSIQLNNMDPKLYTVTSGTTIVEAVYQKNLGHIRSISCLEKWSSVFEKFVYCQKDIKIEEQKQQFVAKVLFNDVNLYPPTLNDSSTNCDLVDAVQNLKANQFSALSMVHQHLQSSSFKRSIADDLIDGDVFPVFIDGLKSSYYEIQIEALNIVGLFLKVEREDVIDATVMGIIVELICSPHQTIVNLAMHCLTSIANLSVDKCKLLCNHGLHKKLLCATKSMRVEAFDEIIIELCKKLVDANLKAVHDDLLQISLTFLESKNPSLLCKVIDLLNILFYVNKTHLDTIIAQQKLDKIVALATHENILVQSQLLSFLCNIMHGDRPKQKQALYDSRVIPMLSDLMDNKMHCLTCLQCLNHVSMSEKTQVKAMLECDLVSKVLKCLTNEDKSIRELSTNILVNLIVFHADLNELAKQFTFESYGKLLDNINPASFTDKEGQNQFSSKKDKLFQKMGALNAFPRRSISEKLFKK